ncbi:iron-sulfur cluster repair di-iron protein [Flavobacterium nackdongense]|uniref:Iron-sulfur cluster repair di-iron protein n=1 Tax=Flavobacterium nackdongense TaxID=2547394 RepID=A0A4P6YCM7_9FLAO|nr:iron-sulfur cluster repair di-iron protein [Flavobacterium nackdongense]QBN18604.1 iron-sulfur cluster repair di-iron protein [Flavobacterium nackdongense]
MSLQEITTIGDFVAKDYRTAEIFTKYEIDFCCKGQRTIDEVCKKMNLNEPQLLHELNAVLATKNDSENDFDCWSLDVLIDYIEKTHHRYVEEKTQALIPFLDKLCNVHGVNHPELCEINALFKEGAKELASHMKKEEMILFPFVKEMINATKSHGTIGKPFFETVKNPISAMMNEHETEGERFRAISALTNNYTPPEEACNTYQVTYAMLQEFEQDLHKHIHLESNILFPKAKALEKFFSTEE